MRTLSVVGVLGFSLLAATSTLVAASLTTGCSDEGIRPVSFDAGVDAPDSAVRVSGEVVFVADGVYGVAHYGDEEGVLDGGDAGEANVTPGTSPVAITDRDAVLQSGAGSAFILERSLSVVHVLDESDPARQLTETFRFEDLNEARKGAKATLVQGTAEGVALVASADANAVQFLDSKDMRHPVAIPLDEYVSVGDSDGLVDIAGSAYSAKRKTAYVLIQRIDRAEVSATPKGKLPKCQPQHGAVVGFDTAAESVAEFPTEANPRELGLLGFHPIQVVSDPANDRLIVLDLGCMGPKPVPPAVDAGADGGDAGADGGDAGSDGGDAGTESADAGDGGPTQVREDAPPGDEELVVLGRGIESIDLRTGFKTWLYQPSTTGMQELSGIVWVSPSKAYVRADGQWRTWDPREQRFTSMIAGFPLAPTVRTDGRIVGLGVATEADGGQALTVVAFDPATNRTETIAPSPFGARAVDLSKGVSSAIFPKGK